MPATFAMTIRLPVPLKERLQKAAEQRGESQNNIIIAAIERELAGDSVRTLQAKDIKIVSFGPVLDPPWPSPDNPDVPG